MQRVKIETEPTMGERDEFVKAVMMMMMRAAAITNDGQNTTRGVKNNS